MSVAKKYSKRKRLRTALNNLVISAYVKEEALGVFSFGTVYKAVQGGSDCLWTTQIRATEKYVQFEL